MKRAFLMAMLLLGVTQSAVAAGPAQWTWEAGKQTNNGSITVKSVSGGSTYSGTQNPTGAVARTNQSAVTQPPTVVIQATGGSAGSCVGITRTSYGGNLGGLSGADAKCVAEFGTGWRMGTLVEVAGCLNVLPNLQSSGPWVHGQGAGTSNCGSWNSTNSDEYGGTLLTASGTVGATQVACSGNRGITCVKLP